MKRTPRRLGLVRLVAVVAVAAGSLLLGAGGSQAGASHAQIEGSGSSWSSNAINQWVADVDSKGLRVVYTASGSAQGRKDYANQTVDFAVSDIGYAGTDQFGGSDTSNRPYAYLPVVAGGTSFPYQVKVGGQLKKNIRLTGLTLAKIFTNQITNWNDPAITADNNGQALPSLPIIPIVHSEGSGSTAQFTRYLDTMFPDLWRPFQGKAGLTEFFPAKKGQIAQNGSDGVMNFISSSGANGAIGYDEYSYALAKNYPVIKLGNAAGYFTAPTQYNVAVALTQAQINQDKNSTSYLLQILDNVYRYTDPRTYAMSSYSYMIIPTAPNDPKMTTAKRQTLADFLFYSTCEGQAETGPIGYSPLPINLAQASFDQVARLKQADPGVDLASRDVNSCHNPTFVPGQPNRNYLAEIAPQPPLCDKTGQGPCASGAVVNGNPANGRPGGSGNSNAAGNSSSDPGAVASVDPVTGDLVTRGGGTSGRTVECPQDSAVPTASPSATASPGATASPSATASRAATASVGPAAVHGAKISDTAAQVPAANDDCSPQAEAQNVPTTISGNRSVGTGTLGVVSAACLVLLVAGPAVWTWFGRISR